MSVYDHLDGLASDSMMVLWRCTQDISWECGSMRDLRYDHICEAAWLGPNRIDAFMPKMRNIACFYHLLPALLPRQRTLVAHITLHNMGKGGGPLIITKSHSLITNDAHMFAQTGHRQNSMLFCTTGGRAGGRPVERIGQLLESTECS